MKRLTPSADQAVYHDFIMASTTCADAKRLYYAFVADGPLSPERLDRAIAHAVATHESLRTSVEVVGGELTQVVRETSEITETPWATADWDGTPEGTSRIIRGVDGWWTVPRELAIRVVVGRSPQGPTLVACLFHHVCVDGISTELVAELIRTEYERPTGPARPGEVEQFSGHYPPMLADGLSETYDDWLRAIDASSPAVPEWMIERKLENDHAWTRFLAWDLSEATLGRLRLLTKEYGCSPFEALAACTALYFRRDDGRPAGLGVAHSGRHRPRGFEVVGLLRSYVLDVADFGRCESVREAITSRRDAARHATAHLSRLPSEEASRRAGVTTGWRAGAPGLWQVELSGMYDTAITETMDGFAVGLAPTSVSEDSFCENTGPLFQVSFTIGPGRTEAVMRFIDPPVTRDMAANVASDIESVVEFVAADPAAPLDAAPAFFRLARNHM